MSSTFRVVAAPDPGPAPTTAWRSLVSSLQTLVRAFARRDTRRDDFLAASADLKDYEYRLKSLDEDERCRARYQCETLWP